MVEGVRGDLPGTGQVRVDGPLVGAFYVEGRRRQLDCPIQESSELEGIEGLRAGAVSGRGQPCRSDRLLRSSCFVGDSPTHYAATTTNQQETTQHAIQELIALFSLLSCVVG